MGCCCGMCGGMCGGYGCCGCMCGGYCICIGGMPMPPPIMCGACRPMPPPMCMPPCTPPCMPPHAAPPGGGTGPAGGTGRSGCKPPPICGGGAAGRGASSSLRASVTVWPRCPAIFSATCTRAVAAWALTLRTHGCSLRTYGCSLDTGLAKVPYCLLRHLARGAVHGAVHGHVHETVQCCTAPLWCSGALVRGARCVAVRGAVRCARRGSAGRWR